MLHSLALIYNPAGLWAGACLMCPYFDRPVACCQAYPTTVEAYAICCSAVLCSFADPVMWLAIRPVCVALCLTWFGSLGPLFFVPVGSSSLLPDH